jgi:PAS domain S-box-containing protein
LIEKGTDTTEYRVLTKDGIYRWIHDEVRAVRDVNDQPVEFLGYWIDITGRKLAEDALLESRGKYRDLVENINEVIFSVDLEGKFTYISPAIQRLYGYPLQEVTGQHFLKFIHPGDHSRCIEGFRRRLYGNYDTDEIRIISRSGAVHYVSISPRPIEKDGTVAGFNYVMTDVTERKLAEEALH